MAKQLTKTVENNDPMAHRPKYVAQNKIDMPVEESVRFPRLKLIQALSPEKTKGNDKYIPGLEEGTLLLQSETFTRHIDGEEGIVVIPLAIRKRYVEYVPRLQGGGFVASYDTKEECDNNCDPGNDIQVTVEFLVIEDGTDEPTPFTITFDTPSKLGTAKKWAGFISQYESLEGVKYLVTGKQVQNKLKQSYYNFSVQPAGWVEEKQYMLVHDMVQAITPLFLPAPPNEEI